MPLNSTARLAVAPAAAIASSCSRPPARSSRIAGDDEQRVVDPQREAHRAQHVHRVERQVVRLAEQRRQAERDEDRDDRQDQRHETGDDRAEDEQQDDERRRQPEEQLAGAQVVGGELALVGVRRPLTGDRGVVGRLVVETLHDVVDVLDIVLAVEAEPDEHGLRVAVARDERRAVGRRDDGGRARRAQLARERLDALAPGPAAADHDDLRDLALARRRVLGEGSVEQLVRAAGLRLARDLDVRRQHVPEEHADRRDRRHDGDEPDGDHPPGAPAASPCQPLGHRVLTNRFCIQGAQSPRSSRSHQVTESEPSGPRGCRRRRRARTGSGRGRRT